MYCNRDISRCWEDGGVGVRGRGCPGPEGLRELPEDLPSSVHPHFVTVLITCTTTSISLPRLLFAHTYTPVRPSGIVRSI